MSPYLEIDGDVVETVLGIKWWSWEHRVLCQCCYFISSVHPAIYPEESLRCLLQLLAQRNSCDTTGWKSCCLYTGYTEKKRQNTLNWLQLSFLLYKQVPVLSYSINSWCISCSVSKSCTLLAGRVVLGLAWRHRQTRVLTYNSDVLKCGEKWAPLGKMENETRCHKYWETEETRSDPLDDSMEATHVQRQ